ncbi:MAG: FHA domain-containing protein [bacterium]|nr:FHA domain-containing protein [bacterium]
MAKLIIMFNEKVIREVHVGNEPVKVGRDPSNQIKLDNPAVSRFHAEIYRQGYPFFVEDKNSTNGVFVNDLKVSWKQGIKEGDRITVGKHTLLFRADPTDYGEGKNVSLADIDGTIALDSSKAGKKR